ncbi:hypothetical protein B0H14DRAFT_3853165 [Mycena olivaceomarginata]|nr:hypothetical protein B0H14DRAFT_3853165 [Mycena olivaceomarginata]
MSVQQPRSIVVQLAEHECLPESMSCGSEYYSAPTSPLVSPTPKGLLKTSSPCRRAGRLPPPCSLLPKSRLRLWSIRHVVPRRHLYKLEEFIVPTAARLIVDFASCVEYSLVPGFHHQSGAQRNLEVRLSCNGDRSLTEFRCG